MAAREVCPGHYDDVIMSAIASQITSLTIIYSTVYPGADPSNIKAPRHWPLWPVNSPHKWPVTRKMFPFDDVIVGYLITTHPKSLQTWTNSGTGNSLLPVVERNARTLRWRHNERDCVSNHQPQDCLLNSLFADQSKHQSSASLAFVWGIHRGPVNSPHKWPVTRKMFPFDDVIMRSFLSGR